MSSTEQPAFISYSRTDAVFARRLAADLKASGASVWFDQLDIAPGSEWDEAIEAALDAASRVILVLSPVSVKSSNVRNEISFALDKEKTILPVLHQPCEIPLQLRRVQYIDFHQNYRAGLMQLSEHLQRPIPVADDEIETASTRAPEAARRPPKRGLGFFASLRTRRDPPNLNWVVLLLFSFVTFYGFMMVWNLVMAYWADRVEPGRKVLILYVGAALLAVAWVSSIRLKGTTVFGLLLLACWLTRLVARFRLRRVLESYYTAEGPEELKLNGGLTFFFGGFYFQYEVNRRNALNENL